MKHCLKISFSTFFICSFLLTACQNNKNKYNSPAGYDFTKPEKFSMPSALLEISGICFYERNADTVYAIQDEAGELFHLAWGNKEKHETKFAKKGDFEDVAITATKIFVLRSDGTIFSFDKTEAGKEKANNVTEWGGVLPKGEYEGMYADELSRKLYVLCKDCDDDSKKKTSGFIFDIRDSLASSGSFSIDVHEIKAAGNKLKGAFRPSGFSKNPLTGDWFIVSSVNKLLVVTDSNFKVMETFRLNGNMFNQPEGIAFDAAGNLYISNEGDDFSNGNVLKFYYHKN